MWHRNNNLGCHPGILSSRLFSGRNHTTRRKPKLHDNWLIQLGEVVVFQQSSVKYFHKWVPVSEDYEILFPWTFSKHHRQCDATQRTANGTQLRGVHPLGKLFFQHCLDTRKDQHRMNWSKQRRSITSKASPTTTGSVLPPLILQFCVNSCENDFIMSANGMYMICALC